MQRSFSLDVRYGRHEALREPDSALRLHVSPKTAGLLRLGPELVKHREQPGHADNGGEPRKTVLVTEYRATTNRMLRVSVNGFFESVGVVIASMRELDQDVVDRGWLGEGDTDIDSLARVQGLQERGVI